MKNLLLILLTLINTSYLFSMSKENETALKKIKEIKIIDKNYRNIAILPFNNLSNNKYYDYIGKIIQKNIFNNLKTLTKIYISTNDIPIPASTNSNNYCKIKFDYGTNFIRKANLLDLEYVNDKYAIFPYSDKKKLSNFLKADYLIFGDFKKLKNESFIIYTYIYNKNSNKLYKLKVIKTDKNNINKKIEILSNKILEFFYKNKKGALKIIYPSETTYEIFINNIYCNNKKFFILFPDKYKIFISYTTNNKDISFTTNIKIENNKTNILNIVNKKENKVQLYSLYIISNPSNANIYLDIDYIGKTPHKIKNLKEGIYKIKLLKKGYVPFEKKINIKKNSKLNIKLFPIAYKEKLINKREFYKKSMYISLTAGALSLLTSYYFYSDYEIYKDKYLVTSNKNHIDRRNRDATLTTITFFTGLTFLGVSLYSFLKGLSLEEKIMLSKNINFHNIYIANNKNNLKIYYLKRF